MPSCPRLGGTVIALGDISDSLIFYDDNFLLGKLFDLPLIIKSFEVDPIDDFLICFSS